MKPDENKFSPAQLLKEKYGTPVEKVEREKVTKAKKQVKAKKNSRGKYEVKIVDGVKYMVLKNDSY